VRTVCELVTNALDEDPAAQVIWTDGVLRVTPVHIVLDTASNGGYVSG
jgi:hypothetical protein